MLAPGWHRRGRVAWALHQCLSRSMEKNCGKERKAFAVYINSAAASFYSRLYFSDTMCWALSRVAGQRS